MSDYEADPLVRGAVRAIEQQMRDTATFIRSAEATLASPPVAGSARAVTSQWIEDVAKERTELASVIAGIVDAGVGDVARLLFSGFDHAFALRALLTDSHGLMASPYAVARGMMEAVLQACFMLDPYIPPRTRVLRMLAYRLASVEGNLATLLALGKSGPDDGGATDDGVRDYHDWLERCGFARYPEKKDDRFTQRIALDDEAMALEFNVTASAKQYLRNEAFFYAILSGAAHGRGWFLAGHYGLDPGGAKASQADVATGLAFLALSLSDALVKAVGMEVGADYAPVLKKTHSRRVLLAGLSDEGPTTAYDHETYRTGQGGSDSNARSFGRGA